MTIAEERRYFQRTTELMAVQNTEMLIERDRALMEAERARRGWIAIQNESPANLVRVLAYWLDGHVAVGWFNGDSFVIQDSGETNYPPTHWMYLPPVPEEQE